MTFVLWVIVIISHILSFWNILFLQKISRMKGITFYIYFIRCKKKWKSLIEICVGNFESTEHNVTISNGKQYNNFSYCFYFLLLWLRICIILFLLYTVYLAAARIKWCILRHILTVPQNLFSAGFTVEQMSNLTIRFTENV